MLRTVAGWLGRHPTQADCALAIVLLVLSAPSLAAGSTGALSRTAYVAVNVLLAATVIPRRRYPVAAFAAAAAIGVAQIAFGVQFNPQPPIGVPLSSAGPVFALQPVGGADLAIPVLLYTLAAYRPRPISITGLVVCLAPRWPLPAGPRPTRPMPGTPCSVPPSGWAA